jgi:hypothetical protein
MYNQELKFWPWLLSVLLFISTPFLYIGYVTSLNGNSYPFWPERLREVVVISPFLAGTLGLIILSRLLKVTQARWLSLPTLVLALGVLVSLTGGVLLNWPQILAFFALILATALASFGLGVSGTLQWVGIIITLTVAFLSGIVFILSLFSGLLLILIIYLWPFLGIGLCFRRPKGQ